MVQSIGRKLLALSGLLILLAGQSHAQADSDEELKLGNGSFEQVTDGIPDGWVFPGHVQKAGYTLSIDTNEPAQGAQAVLLDSTEADASSKFGMFNQYLDATPYRGKRVRFRAAVRTAQQGLGGKAQLWLRVDREDEDGKKSVGAFDNMGDRPITSSDWQYFEIIADIEEDAARMTVGILVLGKLQVWIDDASLDILGSEEAKPTASVLGASSANDTPIQPFYNHWLWLVLAVVGVLAFSQSKTSRIQRACLRFAFIYWFLYSFPAVFQSLPPFSLNPEDYGGNASSFLLWCKELLTGYQDATKGLVLWTAHNVLGIEGELVMPRGSGDTTYSYVHLLTLVLLTCVSTGLWTLAMRFGANAAERSQRDNLWVRDLMRTYLRYVLAITMLSYGLHKAGFIRTQFGTLAEWRLERTIGETSPMGLLWTFMAASPAYTFFAGLSEVVAGVFLLSRRTATFGATVAFGVMLNVMLLNFCYDVPVKLYSFHLMFMAVVLLLPDMRRLAGVFLLNRATEAKELRPPYAGSFTIWIQRGCKAAVIIYLCALPIYKHTKAELTHEPAEVEASEHLLVNRGFRWINEYPFNR